MPCQNSYANNSNQMETRNHPNGAEPKSYMSRKNKHTKIIMSITAIKSIVNKTSGSIGIVKRENKDQDNISLRPNDVSNEEIWIPWVANQQEFNDKVIEITFFSSNNKIFIWETGGKVKWSMTGFESPGRAINGNSNSDGDRRLIIEENMVVLESL